MRYARSLGCSWDGTVTMEAAAAGHLLTLQWLRASGCPWGAYTTAFAELNGHRAVKEWAVAHGCDYSEQLLIRLRMAQVMRDARCTREGIPYNGR